MALLFGATTVNYVDRQVLGILAPTLSRELRWTETGVARISTIFIVINSPYHLTAASDPSAGSRRGANKWMRPRAPM